MGAPIKVAEQAKFLGLTFSPTSLSGPSLQPLAAAANRARFAVQARLPRLGLPTAELRIRVGSIMIRPVASYGCQVWAPRLLTDQKATNNCLEQVHTAYLRFVTGGHMRVAGAALRAEACSQAYATHWAYLCCRFWNSLACHTGWLAHHALADNVRLMLQGCRNCWAYHFLDFAYRIGLIDTDPKTYRMDGFDQIMALRLTDHEAKAKISEWADRLWVGLDIDPRTCPSVNATLCTYERWMGRKTPAKDGRACYHSHMIFAMPYNIYMSVARFRLGCWALRVNTDRRGGVNRIPRQQRLCKHCAERGMSCVEDEQHVAIECSKYADLRIHYPELFQAHDGNMLSLMTSKHAAALAYFLHRLHNLINMTGQS